MTIVPTILTGKTRARIVQFYPVIKSVINAVVSIDERLTNLTSRVNSYHPGT